MCDDMAEQVNHGYKMSKVEQRRQKRMEELQTLYNLASGAYGQNNAVDPELAKRCLAEMEKMVLDTPFAGGAN
jgi:hypothetical protein